MPAGGSVRTVYYENTDDDKTVVKFSAGGRTVTSHSQTDSFGRKVFDELQLGTDFVSRQFVYHAGKVTAEHKTNAKVKSSATTQLVSQIILSDGRTLSYEYDAEERITKVTDSIDGTTEYTYDALGQLLTETVNGEVVNSMEYDNYGNIVKKNNKVYTYGDATWKDLLTSYDGQSITYDKQGNPTKYLGHTLTWEKGRQLKSFDGNTYIYNANGIRTSKTIGEVKHTYTLDGTKILRETWAGNTLIPLYDNEDNVCGILYNNVPYYFIKNLQGDVITIVDKDAQPVARYSYDAWGVPTVTLDTSDCQIADINPFRYRGYYYDKEIGLYYLQSRYYDTEVGRFINMDEAIMISIEHATLKQNLFAYCSNDVDYSDYSGCFRIKTWIVSTALDVIFAILNHWMMCGYIALSGTIWTLARTPFTKKLALNIIKTKVIPIYIRGFYNAALTGLRKVLQNFGRIGKEFVKAFSQDIGISILTRALNTRFLEIVTSLLTWGGIISLFFDMADGSWDGYITI